MDLLNHEAHATREVLTVENADLVSLRLLFFRGKLRHREAVGFTKVTYLDKGKSRAWSVNT